MCLLTSFTDRINKEKDYYNFDRERFIDCFTYVNVIYKESLYPTLSARKSKKKRISKAMISFACHLG